MNRAYVIEALGRIDALSLEIDSYVPASEPHLSGFRSDLAGLLNVLVCATYENCVKSIIFEYALRQNSLFGAYAESRYEKINSRIDIGDLHNYAKTFHPSIAVNFKEILRKSRSYYLKRVNKDIQQSYVQLLEWRHTFAHTGSRVTTVEEVLEHHNAGKRVIILFCDAFSNFPNP